MSRRRALLAALALVTLGLGSTQAGALTDPLDGPYSEVHGEMVTGIPTTPSCTTTIVSDYRFHNTAYGSDAPFTGDYVPSCAGPWSKVVLTMSATVKTGTQFDRIGDVLIGGAEVLHLTTAEGESGQTSWSIQRDVTDYSSLLTSRQPTYFIIGNQTDATYTGDFYGTLSLTFYKTSAAFPAASAPDAVIGLNPGVDRGLPTRSGDAPLVATATIPANTTSLRAEVFASGHGAEEEDWWNAPFTCASGGIPYREVGVSVDGRLAGIAPVYPTIYTGGWGPDFWRPMPSPRAFNLRPYTFDLAPFIGGLTDGKAHTFSIATIGQGGCDGYWFLGGNLLLSSNKTSAGRTTGGVTSTGGTALPVSTSLGQQGTIVSDATRSTHTVAVWGTLQPAGQPLQLVSVEQDAGNKAVDAALDVASAWNWWSYSRSTVLGVTTASTQHSTYSLVRTGPSWTLTDDQDVTNADGTTGSLRDSMTTVGPVEGITGVGNVSHESWRSTTAGVCTDHELSAAAQNVLQDSVKSC